MKGIVSVAVLGIAGVGLLVAGIVALMRMSN